MSNSFWDTEFISAQDEQGFNFVDYDLNFIVFY